jgi:hypothetical protein
MKAKLLFATVSCLLLFAAGKAQMLPVNISHEPPEGMSFVQTQKFPMPQQISKTMIKVLVRSFWEGRGTNLLAGDPDTLAMWGAVSDEQWQQLGKVQENVMNDSELQSIMVEMQAFEKPDDPLMLKVDEEMKNKGLSHFEKGMTLMLNLMSDGIENILTPEQKQKRNESFLASMGEMPIISLNMFEALGLTDAQKEEMAKIKKELEPEFEQHLEDFANSEMILRNKILDELEKQGVKNHKEMQEKTPAAKKKLADDPEYKTIETEMQSKTKAFATKFKTRMFDVLTDGQWKRLQELIDNPPAHAKVWLEKLKAQKEKTEKSGEWTPGPNSWRPGNPIPEGYRQERNTRSRFPRAE